MVMIFDNNDFGEKERPNADDLAGENVAKLEHLSLGLAKKNDLIELLLTRNSLGN